MLPRRYLSLVLAALAVGAGAPAVAGAATPKVSAFTVKGSLDIWVEPAGTGPTGTDTRLACVPKPPSITATVTGTPTSSNSDAKLMLQGFAPRTSGLSTAFPRLMLQRSSGDTIQLFDGSLDIDPTTALGFHVDRAGEVFTTIKNLKHVGHFTIVGWYTYSTKIAGLRIPVVKMLPIKSIHWSLQGKNAGECAAAGAPLGFYV